MMWMLWLLACAGPDEEPGTTVVGAVTDTDTDTDTDADSDTDTDTDSVDTDTGLDTATVALCEALQSDWFDDGGCYLALHICADGAAWTEVCDSSSFYDRISWSCDGNGVVIDGRNATLDVAAGTLDVSGLGFFEHDGDATCP